MHPELLVRKRMMLLTLVLLVLFFLGVVSMVRLQEMRTLLLLNLEKLVEKRTEDLHTVNAVLTQSEARLKSVFENIPDLIWLKDTKGVYLACNQAFERFFAMDTEQIIGKTDDDYPVVKGFDKKEDGSSQPLEV